MTMPGRKYSVGGSGYRYGFNGQENSDEIAAGLTTAMYWEYDSRIGRRWNRDPVLKIWESPYLTFGDNPIYFSDLEGDSPKDPGPKKPGKKIGDKVAGSNGKDGPVHIYSWDGKKWNLDQLEEVIVKCKLKLSKPPNLNRDYSAAITRDLKALKTTPEQIADKIKKKAIKKLLPNVGIPVPESISNAIDRTKELKEFGTTILDLQTSGGKTQFPSAYIIGSIIEALGGKGSWAATGVKVLTDELDDIQKETEEMVLINAHKNSYDELNLNINAYNGHYKDGFVRLWIKRSSLIKIKNDKAVTRETLAGSTYNGMYNGSQNIIYSHMIYFKASQLKNPIISTENIGYIPTGAQASNGVKIE
jgi:hypothetical protein